MSETIIYFLPSHKMASSNILFCKAEVMFISPWPIFIYSILYLVLVHTTGISPSRIISFLPKGELEGESVTKTFTFLLSRGLGFQPYHSFIGAVYFNGRCLVTRCLLSSTIIL